MKPSENYTTHFIEMKNDRENKKNDWMIHFSMDMAG